MLCRLADRAFLCYYRVMRKILIGAVFIIILTCVGLYTYSLGVKSSLPVESSQNFDTNVTTKMVLPSQEQIEMEKIYNNESTRMVSEDEKVYWKTYTNSELGISFLVPKYCGDPIMNQYYPDSKIIKGGAVQGIFPENCPIRSFSARTTDYMEAGGDDTSFGHFAAKKIPEDKFNSQTWGNLKAYMEFYCFYGELGCGHKLEKESIDFAFNLKSSKYPSVNFQGKVDEPFRKILNSLEIK